MCYICRMSVRFPVLAILSALALAGCQSAPSPPDPWVAAGLDAAERPSVPRLREAFLAAESLPERLQRLDELESQALHLAENEPLKLGAIGTAILDLHQGSLVGHYALARFYQHVDSAQAAALHGAWVALIKADMASSVADERADPHAIHAAMTRSEAQMFVVSESMTPVGSIYQSSEPHPFAMLVVGRPASGPLQRFYFSLDGAYRGMREELGQQLGDMAPSPSTFLGLLARSGDTAAQAAIGALLIARDRPAEAVGWLRAASRTGNVLANTMLARIFWQQSIQAETDEDRQAALDAVMENYLHAIALGSADAMYALGGLYLSGAFGEDNRDSGIPLLRQAGDLDHSDALLYLAHLHGAGELVEQDPAKAEGYFIRSASLNNSSARLSYARYLMAQEREGRPDAGDERAIGWLKELAEEHEHPEAMLLLGNLHARGLAARQNIRAAYRWYRDAAEAAPNNASIVNEVAWTLTVSDLDRLRRVRYAKRIMTAMMQSDPEARAQPEYLDTWAATYAATGDFGEAVRLQQLALQKAADAERHDVLDILQEHLELFMAGKPVIEQAP